MNKTYKSNTFLLPEKKQHKMRKPWTVKVLQPVKILFNEYILK